MSRQRVVGVVLLVSATLFGVRIAHDEVEASAHLVTCARRVSDIGTKLLKQEVTAGLGSVDALLRCHLRAEADGVTETQHISCLRDGLTFATRKFAAMAAAQDAARRQLAGACGDLSLEDFLASSKGLGFEAVVDFCDAGAVDKPALAACVVQLVHRTAAELIAATKPRACAVLESSGLHDAIPELPCFSEQDPA